MVVVDWLQASITQVVSPGDEMEVAPGGVIFEPVAEPLAAILKYRLFTVSVCQCDVSLLEEKYLLRLLVSVTTRDTHTHTRMHTHTQTRVVLHTSSGPWFWACSL